MKTKFIQNIGKDVFETDVVIPAYDSQNNGLIVVLKLKVHLGQIASVKTVGQVAEDLKKNFIRVTEILASIKTSWQYLGLLNYTLQSDDNRYCVKDARSSSMALCIALLNIHHAINGKLQNFTMIGSGILRIDGSFEKTCFEDKKKFAITKVGNSQKKFLSATNCKHVFDLDKLINNSIQGINQKNKI